MNSAAASRNPSETLFATPAIVADRRADGSIVVKSTTPLQPAARCIGDWLEHWARQAPERIFLADRASADAPWTTVTYKDALQQVRSAAAWILAQGLSAERPLVILSDNSVEHALFALAAQHVGVPSAAISPAYSLMSKDFDKLKSMVTLLGARRDLRFRHQSRSPRRWRRSSHCIQPRSSAAVPAIPTPSRFAPSQPRRKRPTSKRHSPRSRRTRSQNSCSRQARPVRPRP